MTALLRNPGSGEADWDQAGQIAFWISHHTFQPDPHLPSLSFPSLQLLLPSSTTETVSALETSLDDISSALICSFQGSFCPGQYLFLPPPTAHPAAPLPMGALPRPQVEGLQLQVQERKTWGGWLERMVGEAQQNPPGPQIFLLD